MNLNESEYEKRIISFAVDNGFKYIPFDELFSLRNGDFSEVIIESHFKDFILDNNDLTNDMLNDVIRKIKDLKGSELINANMQFQKYLTEGIKVWDKRKERNVTIFLFKKTGNNFVVTNQFKMKTTHVEYDNQIPDVVLYMNGLPISVIELKSPINEEDNILEKAYQQIENYKIYLKDLFIYNVFNIISDGNISKVGSLTSSYARYQNWRGEKFDSPESYLFKDLLKEEVLIEVITNYSFYEESEKMTKIISGYHQFYGVKKALISVDKAMRGNKKGGIFWHTQGSGKSFSMMFFVKNFSKLHLGTTFVVITDRNNLDNQLYKTFKKNSNFIGQKLKQIDSIETLRNELKNIKQDGVYFTTIQKFNDTVGELINRDDVIIISDEAHRSHNNINGKYVVNLKEQKSKLKYGSAKRLRDAFPKATFIGFTGTPIESIDKSTTAIFGDIITEYKMPDAERDGVIVPINYESRKAVLKFDSRALSLLDEIDANITDELNSSSNLPTEMKKKFNKSWKKLKNFIGDPDRIKGVVKDLIQHYNSRKDLVAGKAMIVALDRHIALSYYKEIIKQKPEWKNIVKLIVTTNAQNDDSELIEATGSSSDRKKFAIEFKKASSKFKIAIVVDMWLTGFDVPSLDTLYLDKPIKMHNLMQAIARTNRVYSNKKENVEKEAGLVVDYIGIWSKLGEALAFYSGEKSSDNIISLHDLNSLKEDYLKNIKIIQNNYEIDNLKIDYNLASTNGEYAFNAIDIISENIIKQRIQSDFVNVTKTVSKMLKKIISVLSQSEIMEFQLLISARIRLIKLEMDNIDFVNKNKKVLEKIQDTIKYEKTVVVNEVNNTQISLSSILKFIQKKEDKNIELSAKEKASAIRLLIKEVKKINLIKASKLSKDLKRLLDKYDSSHITREELEAGFKLLSDKSNDILTKQEHDEFTNEERGFYDILKDPIKQTNFDKDKIELIFRDLLKVINDDNLVNKQWAFSNTMRKKTRGHLKIMLRKYNYPPKEADYAREKIIDQIVIMKGYK
ncbi:MAG: HsdR family type I site-specific deoxyribonuclease [Mycoplasma sp.]|nr:HsdR family type I site-specific deoxyribonuclease [Mycoplasma sp.]